MLTSNGPANNAGNNVSTSIFMPGPLTGSSGLAVLDDFHGAAQAFLGAAGQEQGADGIDGHSLPSNDLAHISRIHAQFVNRRAIPIHRRDADLVGMLHESFND